MALIGYNPNELITFTSKYDTSDPKTEFVVRPMLTKQEDMGIEDNVWESKGIGKRQHQQWKAGSRHWKILEAMFAHPNAGWKHLKDGQGNDIPFSLQNLQMLPEKVRDELVELVKPPRLTDEDEQD